MTYKYLHVRRDIYETNPASELNSYRSLSDMRKLFNLPFWGMLIITALAIAALPVIIFLNLNSLWFLVAAAIIIVISIFCQMSREKRLYNDAARANELTAQKCRYEQYVANIWKILLRHGINTPEKVEKLRLECNTALKKREEKYSKVSAKAVDMLIGVPLGALIASIMYTDNSVVPTAIGALIIIGFIVWGGVKIVSTLKYYSDGYFKDKNLSNILNELHYAETPVKK